MNLVSVKYKIIGVFENKVLQILMDFNENHW